MPGQLNHLPSLILREYLIKPDLGIGTDPDDDSAWPIYAPKEPDGADNLILVTDTAGVSKGRTSPDAERDEVYGIFVRLRSADHTGGSRAWTLAMALDNIDNEVVVLDGTSYIIRSVQRTSPVIPLGENVPNSRRYVFTVNALASVRLLA